MTVDRRMRVAFLSYEFPPVASGGAGTYAGELVYRLARRGIDVTVLSRSGAASGTPGVRLVQVAPTHASVLSYWRSLPGTFRRAFGNRPPDIIHANHIADLTLRKRSIPRALTLHHASQALCQPGLRGLRSRLLDVRGETGVVPFAEKYAVRRSDRVITVSEAARADIVRYYASDPDRVVVIHNGARVAPIISTREVEEARLKFGLSALEPVVLSIARLEDRKGTDVLLRAFAKANRVVRCRLILAGAGRPDPYLDQAKNLGITDAVTFVGYVDDRSRDVLLSACDVFVQASRYEGFGLSLVDALAQGIACVATRTGIATDGRSGEVMKVVTVEDVGAMGSEIISLLREPASRNALGRAAKAYIQATYNWDKTADQTARLYRELLASAG